MKTLRVGRKILVACMFIVMMSSLAGCFAYVDHDHRYRRGDDRRGYYYHYRDYRR
jgi:hypothetical protein